MKRICVLACSLLLGFLAASARADQTTSTVQQALKDQGFYYGDVTGQKNSDTTAAIQALSDSQWVAGYRGDRCRDAAIV